MGGGKPKVPPPPPVPQPTEEEKALQREQIESLRFQRELLEQQQRQQNLLQPILLDQLGIRQVMDTAGNTVSFERIEQGPSLQDQFLQQLLAEQKAARENVNPLRQQIEDQILERQAAALEGRLPVDPAVVRNINEERTAFRQSLAQRFGPGFETSSPGIQAMADFEQRTEARLADVRHGRLSLGEALGGQFGPNVPQLQTNLGLGGTAASQAGSRIGTLGGTLAGTFAGSERAGSIAQGFNPILARGLNRRLQQQESENIHRQQQYQAALQRHQSRGGLFGAIGGAIGGAAGTFFGGPLGGIAGSTAGRTLGGFF